MPHSAIQLYNGEGEMLFPRSKDINKVLHENIPMGEYLNNFIYSVFDQFYPIGSIIILDNDTDPNNILINTTWEKTSEGKILVGCGYLDNDTSKQLITPTSGPTGAYTVALTIDQMPSHNHVMNKIPAASGSKGYDYGGSGGSEVGGIAYTGSGQAHSNMMPYIAVNIWERVL